MAIQRIELNKKEWKFRQVSSSKWYPASVPGCVHTDLLRNKLIDNPFFGLNEKKQQWIEEKDWEYLLEFENPEDIKKYSSCILELEGLDTYADIYLNDLLVLSADNMFTSYEIDIYSYLNPSGNQLKIIFHSPYLTAKKYYDKLGYQLPANNDEGELRVSPFTRKAPYMYGWDWGPRLLTSGIWKSLRLKLISRARINYSSCSVTKLGKNKAELLLEYEFQIIEQNSYQVIIRIDDLEMYNKTRIYSTGSISKTKKIKLKKPELWWPRGFGEQKLYNVEVLLRDENETLDIKEYKIGIRQVRLNQVEDENGSSFSIEINGKDIFARGANLIPLEYFPSEITNEKYEELIDNAISVNMNMLRCWG
ncbi:MAG: glycosyl hydrolase 2 galactose-binding domain-containing protein, partial [Bacteroidales bacterium]